MHLGSNSEKKGEKISMNPQKTEHIVGASLGAAIGTAIGGPIGAVVGTIVGHVVVTALKS